MINDGKCYLWLPSFLTLSTLDAEAAATINAVHTALGIPGTSFVAGDRSPYADKMLDLASGGASWTRPSGGGLAPCGPFDNLDFLTIPFQVLIASCGGDVEGFPVWFVIDDIAAVCPFGDGKETWGTWGTFGESHKPAQFGDKWYRSNNVGQSGAKMHASEWVAKLASGLQVITEDEFKVIQAENADKQ